MTTKAQGSATSVSVVVPVYSGEQYLSKLVEEVAALRALWSAEQAPMSLAELILVDDSAKDGSSIVIDALARNHSWVVSLHLSRNFGQHSATVAGILYTSGDWVVTIDEDLQHPIDRVPEMLRLAVKNEADIVYARSTVPVHQAKVRDWTSKGFKHLLQWVTGNPNIRHVSSFRLMRGEVARSSASVAMHDTYFDVNLTWFSQRIVALPMALRDERFIKTGRSGYRLSTLISHGWRMLFSSQVKLLQLSTIFGFATTLVTLIVALVVLAMKIIDPKSIAVEGWTSLILAISFFGGITVLMLGIALQYLSTLVLRAHGKPSFFVIDRKKDVDLHAYFSVTP